MELGHTSLSKHYRDSVFDNYYIAIKNFHIISFQYKGFHQVKDLPTNPVIVVKVSDVYKSSATLLP